MENTVLTLKTAVKSRQNCKTGYKQQSHEYITPHGLPNKST